jgi:benzoate-CoA ligase
MNAAEVLLGPARGRGLGDCPALMFAGGTVSYAELEARANRVGHGLRDLGVRSQDRVLLMVDDRPAFFYGYLGAMKLGAVPVALNLRASAEELAFIIDDTGCRVFIVDSAFLPAYRAIAPRLAAPPTVVVADHPVPDLGWLGELMEGRPDTLAPAAQLRPDDMALWMYTSGTTGRPKGVVHRQRAIPTAARFLGGVLGVGPGDRLFATSKLFFAFSLGHCLLASLQLGAATVLLEGWPSAEAVADVVVRHRPTVMFSVPTLYRNLLRDGQAGNQAFGQVRHFVAAGERLPESVFADWRAVTGRPILEGVGATETLMMFLANRPDQHRPGASGRPTPGTEVRLADDAGTAITEPDRPGVAWVRSDGVAAGYWNQPETTAAAFHDGWYRTGDAFTRDADGWFRHQGRSDDMLKISGQWVSPAEIEALVLENPDVTEAAVVGVADRDGLTRLALYLVPTNPAVDRGALEAAITANLTARLSVYKCPRRFVYLDEMPRTATGKVQRFVLREMTAGRMEPGP